MAFLVLEGVELLALVHDRAEHMPELLVIVELNVALARRDIARCVLKKQLLLSLDEHWIARLAEDIEEGVVSLGDDLRH